jgi:hypothetical protein
MGHGRIHELEELGTSGWSASVFNLRYQLFILCSGYMFHLICNVCVK